MLLMEPGAHIRVLPARVANKIAAGEVVERPASVIKELVENSIDAAASQVDVEITAGGRKLISIRDNGYGMNRDDALLAIERHATSKIRDVDDIERIGTLGFRGEALAAIASVSRFRMTTCDGGPIGTEIVVIGGKIQDVREIGRPAGTTMEVRDIFFNVPARKKFLRSYQTEQAHIRTVFMVQALASPAIGMTLKIDDRHVYELAGGGNLENRVEDLFGADYRKNLKSVNYQSSNVTVTGYISIPAFNRSNREEQYIFVNGRPTSAAVLSFAIREGYHTLLPKDRYPSVFLFIKTDPEQVDVNVHPAKREVRFRHPSEVRDAVITAIRKTLELPADLATGGMEPEKAIISLQPKSIQLKIENLPTTRIFKYPRGGFNPETGRNPMPVRQEETRESNKEVGPPADSARTGTSPWSSCRVLGQVGSLYVVLETEDGMILMDPHAAHERVLFEQYMSAIVSGKVKTQGLLLPETIEMIPKDALRVRKHVKLLAKLGFGISEFGGDAFVIDAIPACLTNVSAASLLKEVAEALEQAGQRGGEKQYEELIAQAACKSAVKARDKLSLQEIEQLVVDLAGVEMPYTCPHGRPTLIFTSFQELNKKFGRE